MFSLKKGFLIASVDDKKIYIDENDADTNSEILSKFIQLPKGKKFQFIPPNDSFRMACFGSSGSGKSTLVASIIKEYQKMYKKHNVFILSPTRDDEAYQKLKNIEYIKIDDSLIDDPLHYSEFENCLIIFDDSEVLSSNKTINKGIELFRDQVLENGRKLKISAIIINHLAMNGVQTKKILNECQITAVFPKSNFASVKKLAERYWGWTKPDIDYLKKVPSRWVVVKSSYPQAILSEGELRLI